MTKFIKLHRYTVFEKFPRFFIHCNLNLGDSQNVCIFWFIVSESERVRLFEYKLHAATVVEKLIQASSAVPIANKWQHQRKHFYRHQFKCGRKRWKTVTATTQTVLIIVIVANKLSHDINVVHFSYRHWMLCISFWRFLIVRFLYIYIHCIVLFCVYFCSNFFSSFNFNLFFFCWFFWKILFWNWL